MNRRNLVRLLVVSCSVAFGIAVAVPSAWSQEKGKWVNISGSVVAKLAADGKKPGEFGPAAGVAVDRVNGDVYMVISNQGLWKSADHGATFERVDGGTVSGRIETGFAMDIDPAGARIACFPVYGPAAIGTERGKKFQKSMAEHIDCIAVDWATTSMLAIKHESGGTLIYSPDGAKTWKILGKGFEGAGLFDAKTLVAIKDKSIQRSTDAGETWTRVSDLKPTGLAMRVFKGTGYWVSEKGLLVSLDQGKTWKLLGSEVPCTIGPYFGKDEKSILVGTRKGLMETTDAGQSWKLAAPLPPGLDGGIMCNYGWDPVNDIFYAGRMSNPTFKLHRAPDLGKARGGFKLDVF